MAPDLALTVSAAFHDLADAAGRAPESWQRKEWPEPHSLYARNFLLSACAERHQECAPPQFNRIFIHCLQLSPIPFKKENAISLDQRRWVSANEKGQPTGRPSFIETIFSIYFPDTSRVHMCRGAGYKPDTSLRDRGRSKRKRYPHSNPNQRSRLCRKELRSSSSR